MAKQSKFKFVDTPKSFKKPVEIVMVDGSTAAIEFSFIYRTRKQFAELADANINDVKADQKADGEAQDRTMVEWYDIADTHGVTYVLKIVDGWDLEEELNETTLIKLENENPGSLAAIANIYRKTVAEARTKN
jgi:hypothetical protein